MISVVDEQLTYGKVNAYRTYVSSDGSVASSSVNSENNESPERNINNNITYSYYTKKYNYFVKLLQKFVFRYVIYINNILKLSGVFMSPLILNEIIYGITIRFQMNIVCTQHNQNGNLTQNYSLGKILTGTLCPTQIFIVCIYKTGW